MDSKDSKEELERVAEVERAQNTRACLCGETDHRLLMFSSQVFFGVFAAMFFAHQLIKQQDTQIYLPLLTSLFGIFLPSPNFGSRK